MVGDGAFQMTGMELLTARRLGLNPIVILLNNGVYGSLRAMGHQDSSFVNIANLDYAEFARVLGGQGFAVETGQQLREALRTARQLDTFSILDVRLAPDDVSPALARLGELFARTLKG
jgi:indolepyruvate decarboxylase